MGLGIGWLTIDSHEPRKLGEFWKEALGLEIDSEIDDEAELALKGSGWGNSYWHILFYKAPDEKQVKNRLHLDLVPDDQDAEVARLEALGAKKVDIGQRDVSWVVMADPEGNEFCLVGTPTSLQS